MRGLQLATIVAACLCGLAPHAIAREPRSVSIADLTGLRDIGGPYSELALSPDGSTAVVVERRTDLAANNYTYVVIAIDTVSGQSREVGDAGQFVLRSDSGRHAGVGILRRPQFSADSRHIFYLREYDGAIEIWRAAIDGSGAAALVRAEGDIRRFRVDGDQVLYETSTARASLAADTEHGQYAGFAIDDRFTPSYSLTPMLDVDRDVRRWIFNLNSMQSAPATPEQPSSVIPLQQVPTTPPPQP